MSLVEEIRATARDMSATGGGLLPRKPNGQVDHSAIDRAAQAAIEQRAAGDQVNSPAHYGQGAMECIEAIEGLGLGFNAGNVVKYMVRAPHKGSELVDLRKARWYLERLIAAAEGGDDTARAPGKPITTLVGSMSPADLVLFPCDYCGKRLGPDGFARVPSTDPGGHEQVLLMHGECSSRRAVEAREREAQAQAARPAGAVCCGCGEHLGSDSTEVWVTNEQGQREGLLVHIGCGAKALSRFYRPRGGAHAAKGSPCQGASSD